MKFLPEVGPGYRHNLLDFDDPDYDSDPGSGLQSRSRIRITIRIHNKNIYYLTANYSTTAILFNKQENNMVTSLPYLLLSIIV